jgi:TPR repeat protein
MRRLLAVWVILIASVGLSCHAAQADVRVALVIGNGAYQNAPSLINPAHDAADVAAALKRDGFDVILATDLKKDAMEEATIRFARAARAADVAMFYYSGHALQYAGVNYLAPIDTKLDDEADLRRLVRLDDIVGDLQQARNLRVLVLDSCRDNPLADDLKRSIGASRALPLQRGLAKIDPAQGMIVSYATQSGRTASDGDGRNSPYTAAFLKNIEAPEEIGTIFRHITADVYETTAHQQLPELSLSMIGDYYLHGRAAETATAPSAAPDADVAARADFEAAGRMNTVAGWDAFLKAHPQGLYATLANEGRSAAAKQAVASLSPAQAPNAAGTAAPSRSPSNLSASQDDRAAAERYSRDADQGDASAQANLGYFYENGRGGLVRDDNEALRLYKLAADQGNARGQADLGRLYAYGRGGLARDDNEAARLFKLSADQGDAVGQGGLGFFYWQARGGVPHDENEAARLYKLAADQGYARAQQNLGFCYENGKGGLPQDDREAARLFKLSAAQGDPFGQNSLGGFYLNGRGGLPRDDREAARLYRLAADQGDANAQGNLGYLYSLGMGGLPQDYREAARLYKLAADQGNAIAQVNLGGFYETGRGGLTHNNEEAVRLYRLAAAQGDLRAKSYLQRLGR